MDIKKLATFGTSYADEIAKKLHTRVDSTIAHLHRVVEETKRDVEQALEALHAMPDTSLELITMSDAFVVGAWDAKWTEGYAHFPLRLDWGNNEILREDFQPQPRNYRVIVALIPIDDDE